MHMVSKGSDSTSSKSKRSNSYGGEQSKDGGGPANLFQKLQLLKKQIQADRAASIKERLKNNRKELGSQVSQTIRRNNGNDDNAGGNNMLISRMENPHFKFTGFAQGSSDKDHVINGLEFLSSLSVKLPHQERLPPYTTWIFLDRNQRMAEDQSVVGRRRIYYDQHGGEALICSDSEEDLAEPEEEKHEFSPGEDRLLWMAFEENGTGEEVVNAVGQFIGGSTFEIQERYNVLKEKYLEKDGQDINNYAGTIDPDKGICLYKSLNDALDSFDNLFCRICLQFDCRMHGCSPTLVYPMEKHVHWTEHDDNSKPCSSQCFLQLKATDDLPDNSNIKASDKTQGDELEEENNHLGFCNAEDFSGNDIKYTKLEKRGIPEKHGCSLEAIPGSGIAKVASNLSKCISAIDLQESSGKRKVSDKSDAIPDPVHSSDDSQVQSKKQKTVDSVKDNDLDSGSSNEDELRTNLKLISAKETGYVPKDHRSSSNLACMDTQEYDKVKPAHQELNTASNLIDVQSERILGNSDWKPIEKELYLKGLEIFGRNSCLIARNMLSGLRTCAEVFRYMHDGGISFHSKYLTAKSFWEDSGKAEIDCNDGETPTRSRLLRRKGKTRKLKYSWKSAGHPSIWKRIADGKNKSAKQYTPCGCRSMCGKECPCHQNGTCCEKYCGCSKSCKNRFRGCHCAKSQCRSRQCPCFAAGRECDPDVCRNCWVSCGGGSLGEPPKRGDGQCGNMRLLLRQQQRILLARSDVAGWGAFLKNAVNKNDYLGEYTGELISHREADKRGKIYDRANSSFLFDLNDQYVLDAYRKGDKLKFANHSSNPNCHAKVMLVAGDHRVGIFAKERIEAGEELFYDYRYGPDQAPSWARKPEGSKREDSVAFQGRAKKHHSH